MDKFNQASAIPAAAPATLPAPGANPRSKRN